MQQAAAGLEQAGTHLAEAERELSRWPVDVVAAVPLLGRSWVAERAVARTARSVVAGAAVLAEDLPTVRAGGGGVDLARLSDVRADLSGPVTQAQSALARLEQTPTGLTPPQVQTGVEQALQALAPAVDALAQARTGLDLVAGLLGDSGPRTVLVLLQNNAELRGAGGYAASFALGRVEQGRLALGPLQDVLAVADPPAEARRVPAPPEYLEDYEALAGNTTVWRSWNMSPDVPDSALVGARIAAALLDVEPDVVVLLDVPAMAALAELGGGDIALPDGSTVAPDELAEALLVDAYAAAGADDEVQDLRRAALQGAATTAVGRLLSGGVPPAEAARTLARLARERHLAVWSARPEEQSALVELGAAGELETPPGGDLSHVSVNNIGGNKLDVYVERDLEVDVVVGPDSAQVVQRVRFTNRAPAGLVPYVAGVEQPGVAVSRVELSLPPTARGLAATVDGEPWVGAVHTGPSRSRLITHLELPRGATSVLQARYTVPLRNGSYRLHLVPQALVDDADLRLSVRPAPGEAFAELSGISPEGAGGEDTRPLSETREVVATLRQEPSPSRWDRFRDWWRSPVTLG